MNTAHAKALLPGISRAIREINLLIPDLAQRPNDLVFLTGEPGTERALVARLIHQRSGRSGKSFARILANWKLPPDFAGQIENANGGTVFISLVREFPVDMQYTLLELALDRSFTDPLSGEVREADVRLILTTTLDLETLFERSPLLPDLREMLTRSHIDLPALRERREDIPALVRFALQRARETGQSAAETVDRQVLALLRAYAWPGNAEQLLLVAAQAALKATGPVVGIQDLPEDFINQLPSNIVRLARSIEATPVGTEAGAGEREEGAEGLESANPAPGDGAEGRNEALVTGSAEGKREERAEFAAAEEDSPLNPEVDTPVEVGSEKRSSETASGGSPVLQPGSGGQEAETGREILDIAARLYAQSALLARQMQGPLPPAPETAREIAAARGAVSRPSPELEAELALGLEQILALRRQLAILNQREQDSAMTIRDILQRLEFAPEMTVPDQKGEEDDAHLLASHLAEIDAIIEHITNRLPRISEDIQESIRRILGKKRMA